MHIGISIKGKRALHYLKREDNDVNKLFEEIVELQEPGNVYLSSPTTVLHAVEFPNCKYENKVIAIMCRFLAFREDMPFFG